MKYKRWKAQRVQFPGNAKPKMEIWTLWSPLSEHHFLWVEFGVLEFILSRNVDCVCVLVSNAQNTNRKHVYVGWVLIKRIRYQQRFFFPPLKLLFSNSNGLFFLNSCASKLLSFDKVMTLLSLINMQICVSSCVTRKLNTVYRVCDPLQQVE